MFNSRKSDAKLRTRRLALVAADLIQLSLYCDSLDIEKRIAFAKHFETVVGRKNISVENIAELMKSIADPHRPLPELLGQVRANSKKDMLDKLKRS